MKKTIIRFLLLLNCSWLCVSIQAQSPKKVLFVGNSYTYFWNLPQNVQLLAFEDSIEMMTAQSTAGGSHWGHHWRGERDLETLDILDSGDYDAVVLQNHSMSTINRRDSFLHFGNLLSEKIKSKKARVFLYQTWSRDFDSTMLKSIKSGYEELAKQINARIVPVGEAFANFKKKHPGINLYMTDGSHPSTTGTYLIACVFHAALHLRSPVGLPSRLLTTDAQGEKLYINIQSKQHALFCQEVAAEVVNQYID